MIKKLKLISVFVVIISAITLNLSIDNKNSKRSNFTLSQMTALAQDWGEDMTWDDVAEILTMWDNSILSDDYQNATQGTNEAVCDFVHGFCDNYDLLGDPVYDWIQAPDGSYSREQVDDCDGQPNKC